MSSDIFQAARVGDIEALMSAQASGTDLNALNKHRENILHAAIAWKKPDVVRFAVRNGVDVNRQSCKGRSPLHVAAESKQLECVEMLLSAGANPSLTDDMDREPLWYAAWLPKDDYRVATLLLQHGGNPSHKDKNGRTPLSFSEEVGDSELSTLLRSFAHVRSV